MLFRSQSTPPPNISLPARNTAEFNAFLAEIADQITEEELEEMKFLCGGKKYGNCLPRGKLAAIKTQREFLSFLRHHDIICPEDVSYLVWLLRNAGCIDLAASIEEQGNNMIKTRAWIDSLRLNEALIFFFSLNNAI